MTLPKKLRCISWISPMPLQLSQVTGLDLEFEPVPPQESHSTAVSTVTFFFRPV